MTPNLNNLSKEIEEKKCTPFYYKNKIPCRWWRDAVDNVFCQLTPRNKDGNGIRCFLIETVKNGVYRGCYIVGFNRLSSYVKITEEEWIIAVQDSTKHKRK